MSRWTVDVVDARNSAASFNHVVRITGIETRRTFAIGHMIVNYAESVWTAGNEVAYRLTGQQSFLRASAGLILRTLAVG